MENLLPDTLSGYLAILFAVVFGVVILARYIQYATGDEKTADKLDSFYRDIRELFFTMIDQFEPVLKAEKLGGRAAAKAEIKNIMIKFIETSELVTETERRIILKFDLGFLVDEIEEELVTRGLLPLIPTPLEKVVDTSNPEEDSSG